MSGARSAKKKSAPFNPFDAPKSQSVNARGSRRGARVPSKKGLGGRNVAHLVAPSRGERREVQGQEKVETRRCSFEIPRQREVKEERGAKTDDISQ